VLLLSAKDDSVEEDRHQNQQGRIVVRATSGTEHGKGVTRHDFTVTAITGTQPMHPRNRLFLAHIAAVDGDLKVNFLAFALAQHHTTTTMKVQTVTFFAFATVTFAAFGATAGETRFTKSENVFSVASITGT